jgi:mono/diheme cytochrome c family protein
MSFSKTLLLVAIATIAVAACSKGSNSSSASSSSAPAASTATGEKVFMANCASCHQADGKGVPGTFPPLAGNPVVSGDPVKVIHIVKYGLTGPVVVAGKTYNGMMPAWSPQLPDAAIAAALTYVRASWGDGAGAVTADQVTAVSK